MSSDYRSQELSEAITSAMRAKGLEIRDLAEHLDIVYEHARRATLGVPLSRPILKSLCALLELDFNKIEQLTVYTQLRRRYGDAIAKLIGRKPGVDKIEEMWEGLTPEQQHDAIEFVSNMHRKAVKLKQSA